MENQHLWLLFNEQCMNSNRITAKRVKTKKKKKKKERKRSFETQHNFSGIQTHTRLVNLIHFFAFLQSHFLIFNLKLSFLYVPTSLRGILSYLLYLLQVYYL